MATRERLGEKTAYHGVKTPVNVVSSRYSPNSTTFGWITGRLDGD
jgi:hypothetical protein